MGCAASQDGRGHAADARNSRASSGLPKKRGTGRKKKKRKGKNKERKEGKKKRTGEEEQRRGFAAHRDFAPRDSFRFDHPPLETLHFYCHLLLVIDVWDAHFSFTV